MSTVTDSYNDFKTTRIIGEYEIKLPTPPPIKTIDGYGLKQKEQKFTRAALPKNYDSLPTNEKTAFIDREFDRIENGYWFFNNGNLEYITGFHYFYITWWFIDGKYPDWCDADRDFFYMWHFAFNDKYCVGLIYIANRREGKTYKALSIVYKMVTSKEFAMGGIQSKTNTDAKNAFLKLVKSWKRLPDFLKPIDSGDINPKSALSFEEPSKRDTKGAKKVYNFVLNSSIDYAAATEEAYDGLPQYINFQDEIGKTLEADVSERIKIVRECCMSGSRVVGKIIATSTVEEMLKKGGANCKKVWDKSSPETKSEITAMTDSGLIRYFKPAWYGFRGENLAEEDFIDEYGYSDCEAAKKYLEGLRKDDYSMKRKYPFTIEEAFYVDNKGSNFDLQKIQDQIDYNNLYPNLTFRGNLSWHEGKRDSYVEYHPNPNGRFLFSWIPKAEFRNKKEIRYGKAFPGNNTEGVIGVDPVDNRIVTEGKGSDYAAYGFRQLQPMDGVNSNIFAFEYVNRLPTPEATHEDMIMAAVFYGWPVLPERNRIGCINYFYSRGYEGYLMDRPSETSVTGSVGKREEKGLPNNSDDVRETLVGYGISYIYHHVGYNEETGVMGKCYFNNLLEDWRDFQPSEKWTKYDKTVASFMCLAGARRYVQKITTKPVRFDVPMYNNKGGKSKLIR